MLTTVSVNGNCSYQKLLQEKFQHNKGHGGSTFSYERQSGSLGYVNSQHKTAVLQEQKCDGNVFGYSRFEIKSLES